MAASPPALGPGVLTGASAPEIAVAAVGTALVAAGQIEPNAMERQGPAAAHTFRAEAKNPPLPLPVVARQ